jgi:alkylation response protein AidB-like acyl-CoA dehydrogenase
MERQLETATEYARERRQFGAAIGSFQAVSRKLVDMRLRLETSRLLLYRLGWLLDSGEPATTESALVKLYLSESYVRSSLDALQVHGGYGYMTEYELERELRDAIGSRLYSGTSELQYNIVAHGMGL